MSQYAIGDVLAGKYEIKAILGAGGMGTVYRAKQRDLGRDVAVKVPNPAALQIPGFLERFIREAKTVARLVHDNIVQVYEYTNEGEQIYIVMEYVEGQDLKGIINHPPPGLTVKDIATILRNSCEGLAHAHENGIVHRDIKPHNIMVQQMARGRWRVKIMDFGIAHLEANAGMTMGGDQLTMTGQAIGTPSYMSPEQVRGTGVTAASDIYSFGCVVYYTFTRQTPFTGTGFTIAAMHLNEPPPPIRTKAPGVPEQLESIINHCMEKDPATRPQDATELGERIFEALRPLFDKEMDEIWPERAALADQMPIPPTRAHETAESGAATEVGSTRTGTAAGGPAGRTGPTGPTIVGGDTDVPGDTRPVSGPAAQGARAPQRNELPAELDERLSAATMAVDRLDLGTPTAPSEPAKKGSKAMVVAVAIIIPLFVGISAMAYFANKFMAPDPAEGVQTPISAPGGQPTAPIGTDPGTLPVAATPTVTPTPQPTLTPDPIEQRLARLRESFAKARTLQDRSNIWKDALRDYSDPRLVRLANEFALEIAKAPETVAISQRNFTIGNSSSRNREEQREQNVQLSSYSIGRFEVTALEYCAFLNTLPEGEAAKLVPAKLQEQLTYHFDADLKAYMPKSGRDLHPANGISWENADRYARWLRDLTGQNWALPTEAQWERAARGDRRLYPGGDEPPSRSQAQFDVSEPTAVTAREEGRNQADLRHLSGNVAEWCRDWFDENAYESFGDRLDPWIEERPSGPRPRRVIRGGGYKTRSDRIEELSLTYRNREVPDEGAEDFGFRLVLEGK